MMMLDRYIASSYLKGMVPVLFLLMALFSFLVLAEELEQVGNGTFRQIDAFLVVLYTSPRLIVDLMPVTALLGGLMGLGAMANHQELIAARAAGLSKARMARPVFQATLMVAALVVVMQSLVVPASERSWRLSYARSHLKPPRLMRAAGWRSGPAATTISSMSAMFYLTGSSPEWKSIEPIARAELKTLIEAKQATIVGENTWLLEDVTRTELSDMTAQDDHIDRIQWTNLLSQEQADVLILPVEALAPHELVLYIRHLQENDLDTHHFRVIFWKQMSVAITVIAMGLLSLPLLIGSTRGISAGERIVLGGLIGIGFYLLQQLIGHLTGLFNLIPWVTIMTPVFTLLGISIAAQYWRGFRRPKPPSAIPRED